jgi:Cys-tRNA(Pro)/Cys-tRNA(Cys) deacylase
MAKPGSGGTPATLACERAGVSFSLLTYELDPKAENYGPAAAEALGLDPSVVFKTLVALVDTKPVVALVPVERTCSLRALAASVGAKRAEMAPPAVAERLTGYVVGGISPLGQRQRLVTVIDSSAAALERMWVSGGKRGLELGLAPSDLVSLTAAQLAVIVA